MVGDILTNLKPAILMCVMLGVTTLLDVSHIQT